MGRRPSCFRDPSPLLQDSGLSLAEAARAADARVRATDEKPGSIVGFDINGTAIVEIQSSDTGSDDYWGAHLSGMIAAARLMNAPTTAAT